jgi:hypothetical protein
MKFCVVGKLRSMEAREEAERRGEWKEKRKIVEGKRS